MLKVKHMLTDAWRAAGWYELYKYANSGLHRLAEIQRSHLETATAGENFLGCN